MKSAAIGIGTNLGNRLKNLQQAIFLLNQDGIKVKKVSCVYETYALVPEEAPDSWNCPYFNIVVYIETNLLPEKLLQRLKRLEDFMGRSKNEPRWSPRIIDYDILFYEDLLIATESLQIPHSCFHERFFTVVPAAQLFPYWTYPNPSHPCYGKTLLELAENFRPYSKHFKRILTLEPKLVGIVNITPDSFSDGNEFLLPEKAVKQALSLYDSGASVIELGAQSTRPGASQISSEAEWKRLAPVLEKLKEISKEKQLEICVDSYHFDVIYRAMSEYDIRFINDVSGSCDEKLLDLIAKKGGRIVLMHSLGIPPKRGNRLPIEEDPFKHLIPWGEKTIAKCLKRGLKKDQILLDPGIGYGKHSYQSWQILSKINALAELDCEIFVGHSRKPFLEWCTDLPPDQRDLETGVISLLLSQTKVSYLRVHNVEMHQRLLATATFMKEVS